MLKVSIIAAETEPGLPEISAPIFELSFLQEKRAMNKHSPIVVFLNIFIKFSLLQIHPLITLSHRNYYILLHKNLRFETQAAACLDLSHILLILNQDFRFLQ